MISVFESVVGKHIKRHWGKYALLGGGLTAAALGQEAEAAGIRKALSGGDQETATKMVSSGRLAQKYGHLAAGAGGGLGIKSQLDDESKIEKSKKKK
jgi:hypothetical protein